MSSKGYCNNIDEFLTYDSMISQETQLKSENLYAGDLHLSPNSAAQA